MPLAADYSKAPIAFSCFSCCSQTTGFLFRPFPEMHDNHRSSGFDLFKGLHFVCENRLQILPQPPSLYPPRPEQQPATYTFVEGNFLGKLQITYTPSPMIVLPIRVLFKKMVGSSQQAGSQPASQASPPPTSLCFLEIFPFRCFSILFAFCAGPPLEGGGAG